MATLLGDEGFAPPHHHGGVGCGPWEGTLQRHRDFSAHHTGPALCKVTQEQEDGICLTQGAKKEQQRGKQFEADPPSTLCPRP